MGRSNSGVSGDFAADRVDLLCNSDERLYDEGEKVWAFHRGKWYQAKVQKIESRMKAWTYFVHYLGWKKRLFGLLFLLLARGKVPPKGTCSLIRVNDNVIQLRLPALRVGRSKFNGNFVQDKWDEWLKTEHLMKFTEEDVQKQLVQCGRAATVKDIKPGHKNKTKKSSARGKKGPSKSEFKEKCMITEENMLNIEIPPTLKKQLLDDCEFVTHLGKLVKLPRAPNVDDILKKYFAVRVKTNNKSSEAIQEILSGLRCYFDKALPALLLYKSERKQYEEVSAEHIPPSTVYGAEHLLRLFVKLPEILYDAKIEEEALMNLQPRILDLLKFLQKNQSTFFLSTYQTPEDLDPEMKD